MKTKKNSDFKIGEIVVYPKHGVGEITKIENMEISNIKTSFYVVKMEQSKLTIRVPRDKKDDVGLRKISSKKIIEEVYSTLKLKPKIRRIMWSRRAQEYETKIFSGDPIKISEVVRIFLEKVVKLNSLIVKDKCFKLQSNVWQERLLQSKKLIISNLQKK